MAFRSKTPPIPCACHETSTLEHQSKRFPLRLPHVRKCARHHNESAVARSTHCRHPDSASRRSRSAHGRCERHECTVNSNELAVHGRAPQRSKHQLPFPYRKNPSVCPHCLGKKQNGIPKPLGCRGNWSCTLARVFLLSFSWPLERAS